MKRFAKRVRSISDVREQVDVRLVGSDRYQQLTSVYKTSRSTQFEDILHCHLLAAAQLLVLFRSASRKPHDLQQSAISRDT
jgi:hypothetical protein